MDVSQHAFPIFLLSTQCCICAKQSGQVALRLEGRECGCNQGLTDDRIDSRCYHPRPEFSVVGGAAGSNQKPERRLRGPPTDPLHLRLVLTDHLSETRHFLREGLSSELPIRYSAQADQCTPIKRPGTILDRRFLNLSIDVGDVVDSR